MADNSNIARSRSGNTAQSIGTARSLPNGRAIAAESSEPSHSRQSSSSSFEMSSIHSDDDEEAGLTKRERKHQRRQKRKNTQLHERIVAGTQDVDGDEQSKLVNASMLKNIIINTILVGLWYTFSISISVYNKWMFSDTGKGLDFHFPLFVTSVHMLVQFSLASLVLLFVPKFRPNYTPPQEDEVVYTALDGNESEGTDSKAPHSGSRKNAQEPLMTKWFYLTRISPCGAATALDIGLGNFSLRFITLTFYTMCKSSVLAFVLLFAFLFHLEKPTWRLCAIIFFMTVGVVMMVTGEAAFEVRGFILVMSASFCSGFRWSLTQILLLRNKATSNPFSSIFFLTPVMFFVLFILALPAEKPAAIIAGIKDLAANQGGLKSILLILFPGTLAFAMVSAEFALLQRSSVVTLSVCGIFKEVLTISAAGIVFGDELSPINVSGLIVTIASIAAYNYLKFSKMRRDAEEETKGMLRSDSRGGIPTLESLDRDEEGRKDVVADDDEDELGRRDSSSALMRHDLRLATDLEDAGGGAAQQQSSRSPDKRLRDTE